jgi:hypothetical protein
MNHALVNDFNFGHCPDPDNHTDVAFSDLIEVVPKYWGRNTIPPSNVTFLKANRR